MLLAHIVCHDEGEVVAQGHMQPSAPRSTICSTLKPHLTGAITVLQRWFKRPCLSRFHFIHAELTDHMVLPDVSHDGRSWKAA
jgi:hypothetical protein